MGGGTLIIDDPAQGGSPDGAWIKHFALAPSGRSENARSSGGRPGLTGPGGMEDGGPALSAPVPPASPWEVRR